MEDSDHEHDVLETVAQAARCGDLEILKQLILEGDRRFLQEAQFEMLYLF
jgi:hypothetical protein